jgi:type IV pilus assembly protein PilC
MLNSFKHVPAKTMINFTRDLSIILNAKLLLTDGLKILHNQSGNRYFKLVIEDIIQQVYQGNSFYHSLKKHPKIFDPFYIHLIAIGEMTGNLGEMLRQIYLQLEKISDLKKRLIQASAYPMLVILVAVFSFIFIIYFVVPAFSIFLSDFSNNLPGITRSVIAFSRFLEKYGIFLPILFFVLISLIHVFTKNKRVKNFIDHTLFILPVYGIIYHKNQLSRFCRLLGTLLYYRIPLITALETISKLFPNRRLYSDIQQMIHIVSRGGRLASSLKQSQVFPAMVVQMISIGEETAELPEILLKISEYYEHDLKSSLDLFSSVIEPLIILILGVFIGFILISLYLPLFNISEGFSF